MHRGEDGREVLHGEDECRVASDAVLVLGHVDVGEPAEQLLVDDPDLRPGQVGAEAEVGPEAEPHVGVGIPIDPERLGVVEYILVPVGGLIEEQDPFASFSSTPCSSWSSVTVRVNENTGLTQRTISSTAESMSSGWASRSSRWSGKRLNPRSPPAMALRVVSLPATTSIVQNISSSSSVSWSTRSSLAPPLSSRESSPLSNAWVSTEMMSSAGCSRRSSMSCCTSAVYSPNAWAAACSPGCSGSVYVPAHHVLDHL